MDLRKALSLIAFGFLFLLVNLNLTFNEATLCLTPDFIGWLLLLLAAAPLGSYGEGKGYLKWLPALMLVVSAADWGLEVLRPELRGGSFDLILTLGNLVTAVYLFLLITVLEQVARDCGSPREQTLRTLKYCSVGLELATLLLGWLTTATESGLLAALVLGLLVAALVISISLAVALFRLRKDAASRAAEDLT